MIINVKLKCVPRYRHSEPLSFKSLRADTCAFHSQFVHFCLDAFLDSFASVQLRLNFKFSKLARISVPLFSRRNFSLALAIECTRVFLFHFQPLFSRARRMLPALCIHLPLVLWFSPSVKTLDARSCVMSRFLSFNFAVKFSLLHASERFLNQYRAFPFGALSLSLSIKYQAFFFFSSDFFT